MNDLPNRIHPRLKGYDYNQDGVYFITICIKDKRKLLGQIVKRDALEAPFVELSSYGVYVINTIDFVNSNNNDLSIDKYIVMPNTTALTVKNNWTKIKK